MNIIDCIKLVVSIVYKNLLQENQYSIIYIFFYANLWIEYKNYISIYIFCMYKYDIIVAYWQQFVTCIKDDLKIESIEWNNRIIILSMKYSDRYFFFKKKLIFMINNIAIRIIC